MENIPIFFNKKFFFNIERFFVKLNANIQFRIYYTHNFVVSRKLFYLEKKFSKVKKQIFLISQIIFAGNLIFKLQTLGHENMVCKNP